MKHIERALRKVAILGGTGMVGRRLAALLADHPDFELAMIVGTDPRQGAQYRDVWQEKEQALIRHYGSFWQPYDFPVSLREFRVSSFAQLMRSDCEIVFSSINEQEGHKEDELIEDGRVVFSNSPYRRFDADVPLIVPEVNGVDTITGSLIKYPNCVTSGLLLLLAPLHRAYGLREVVVTTYQSLSGRGDAKYDTELVCGNVCPLFASLEHVEERIRRETNKIMGLSCPMSITCNRTCVQYGHFVEVRLKTHDAVPDELDAKKHLTAFDPLAEFPLPSQPYAPIVLVEQPGRPRPLQDSHHHRGMAVAVGNISVDDEVFDLRLTFVVNNLVRGAAGGILLIAELWNMQRNPGPETFRCSSLALSSETLQ